MATARITSVTPTLHPVNQLHTITSGGNFFFTGPYADDITSQPAHGAVGYGSGLFSYFGSAGYAGLDSFTYVLRNTVTGETVPVTSYVVVEPAVAPAPTDMPVAITRVDEHLDAGLSQVVYGNGTNDARPLLSGTAPAGAVVTVHDGQVNPGAASASNPEIGTATADASGHWSLVPSVDLPLGSNVFTVSSAGATGADAYNITHNWIDPKGEVLTVVQDVAETFLDTDLLSDDTALNGAVLSVKSTTQPVHGSVTGPSADGGFVYTPEAGYLGADRFTYIVKDQFGNEQVETVQVLVEPKVHPPVITGVWVDTANGLESLSYYDIRSHDTTPTLKGTAPSGMSVTVIEYPQGAVLGTVVADASGEWSWTPSVPLSPGLHQFTPVGELPDGSGTTVASNIAGIQVQAPDVPLPQVTSVLDDVGPVTGNVNEYTLSDDPMPTLSGTAQPGSVLHFDLVNDPYGTAQEQSLGTLVTGADGLWSFTTPALPAGLSHIAVTATDAQGFGANEGSVAVTYRLASDINVPALTAVIDDIGPVQGDMVIGATTDDSRVTLVGTAQAGANIWVSVDDQGIWPTGYLPVQADAQGQWVFTPRDALSPGLHHLTYRASSVDGIVAGASTFDLTVSADAVATGGSTQVLRPVLVGLIDDVGDRQGLVSPDGATNDVRPTFTGTAEPGSLVTLYGPWYMGTAVADADWHWSFTPSYNLSIGGHDVFLEGARGTGWDTVKSAYVTHFEIAASDAVSPQPPLLAPVITTLTIDAANPEHAIPPEILASGGHAPDNTPTLSGTGEPGSVIELFDRGASLGTVVAGGDWQWTFTPNLQYDYGDHVFTAVASRADGSGAVSAWYAQDYTLDAVAVYDPLPLETLLAGAGLDAAAPAAAAPATASAVAPTVHAALLDLQHAPIHALA